MASLQEDPRYNTKYQTSNLWIQANSQSEIEANKEQLEDLDSEPELDA